VLVRSGGAHGAQTPVVRGGVDPGEPGLGILRRGAVGVLGTKAMAGLRRTFGGAHAGFLSATAACAAHGDFG
jgi:hypothetical protein